MKLHLVGGFLGSGKTTAITNCSKLLTDKNEKTAVITNDQGNYLVDSRFVQSGNIPFAEVTGGCFCCNYNQLNSQIDALKEEFNPSVIFAETVGSCTDLVATILKPLLKYKESDIEQVTFSTFIDAQLLLMYLQNKTLAFSTETNYIWEKQIEEAEILIINKIDLLSDNDVETLKVLVNDKLVSKQLLFQNSHNNDSVSKWLELIDKQKENKEHKSIEVDYIKYGAGEANLAWLDEEIEIITTNNTAVELVVDFIKHLTNDIIERLLPIGHLKFFLVYNNQSYKLSYTTILDKNFQIPVKLEKCNSIDLLVNARVQTSPNELREIFIDALNRVKQQKDVVLNEKHLSYFQPGFPTPTHRLV
jgi:G3E family GTPase